MVITTGRVAGDYGQPSYVSYHKDRSSRPDHTLLSPAVTCCGRTGSMDAAPERDHVCKAGLCDNKLILRKGIRRRLMHLQSI
eukprot:1150044-Pelagomonas_calceolata.AAC.1